MSPAKQRKTIAIDAMGADCAPSTYVQGLELVAERVPSHDFLVFGDEHSLLPLCEGARHLAGRFEFHHCDTAIAMEDSTLHAMRHARNSSSMGRAINAVAEGAAAAAVSSGNTGALFGLSALRLPTVAGITRPACASFWPTEHGECIVLDVGANIVQSADILVQNAIMGAVLARTLLDRARPRVGLINIGVEKIKGLEFIREADQKLRDMESLSFDYMGFVEPNTILSGACDTLVCDGFTGNIMLKSTEGAAVFFVSLMRRALRSSLSTKVGAWMARQGLRRVKDVLDPRKRNGAMLVGCRGLVIKSHGSADAVSFASAIETACELVELDAVRRIEADIERTLGGDSQQG